MAVPGGAVHRRVSGGGGGALTGSNINFDVYDAELRLADISRAFEAAEHGLAGAPEREQEFIASVMQDHPDATSADVADYLLNEASEEIGRSRQSICHAFVLANYSVFEFGVLRIAENYLKATESQLAIRDFAGSGYEKFLVIAKKLASVALHNEELWEKIPHYRSIRNSIAHNGGFCVNEDEKNKVAKVLALLGDSRLREVPDQEVSVIEIDTRFLLKMNARLIMLTRSAHETLERALDDDDF